MLTVGEDETSSLVTAAWYMAIRSLRGVDSTILTSDSTVSANHKQQSQMSEGGLWIIRWKMIWQPGKRERSAGISTETDISTFQKEVSYSVAKRKEEVQEDFVIICESCVAFSTFVPRLHTFKATVSRFFSLSRHLKNKAHVREDWYTTNKETKKYFKLNTNRRF